MMLNQGMEDGKLRLRLSPGEIQKGRHASRYIMQIRKAVPHQATAPDYHPVEQKMEKLSTQKVPGPVRQATEEDDVRCMAPRTTKEIQEWETGTSGGGGTQALCILGHPHAPPSE